MRFGRLSLLWKQMLPTSAILTVVFVATGLFVQRTITRTATESMEQEARASFRAYESLWAARAHLLASVSEVLSTMSDVRAAFGTRDMATIRDSAGELWSKISTEGAFFLVSDPRGEVIAFFGQPPSFLTRQDLPLVRAGGARFPQQASGFVTQAGRLFQVVVTPVYVQATDSPALLDVLVAGYEVDSNVAQQLKQSTGGSEFLFVADDQIVASTLAKETANAVISQMRARPANADAVTSDDYVSLATPLLDVGGARVGQLLILRSFQGARERIAELRRYMIGLWFAALGAALTVTYLIARRIMQPVAELDRAAAEIARHNYDYRVEVNSGDELGRLAQTFNAMCASIQSAREELIRQERISTIGRLSTSIVHDLRNPLAAIYAGAEMLIDSHLSPEQVERLARNIYRASRGIQQMLQQLLNVSRGKTEDAEVCNVKELITAAWSRVAPTGGGFQLMIDVPEDLEVPTERARMERVFQNLFENAVEAMGSSGSILVHSNTEKDDVLIRVRDTGPGINPKIRGRIFQPFVTTGKKNGLGLGLALSRQTVLDHGGDMWADGNGPGAEFWLRLPRFAGETVGQRLS